MSFNNVVAYLDNPLVLVGFALFLGLAFARMFVIKNPPVPPEGTIVIQRSLIRYWFLLAFLITILGFILKHGELSKNAQRSITKALHAEMEYNVHTVNEMEQNAEKLIDVAMKTFAGLRMDKFKINHTLFPTEQETLAVVSGDDVLNLPDSRFEKLKVSGLLEDPKELRLCRKQCEAIGATIGRTIETAKSVGDFSGRRYKFYKAEYSARIPILEKLSIIDATRYSQLYGRAERVLDEHAKVPSAIIQYLEAVRDYCNDEKPNPKKFAALLSVERLMLKATKAHSKDLKAVKEAIQKELDEMARIIEEEPTI